MGYYVKEKNKGNISAIQLINEMTKQDFKSRLPLLKVIEHVKSFELTSKGELGKPQAAISGDIHFCRDYILGVGNNGVVYLGMWAGSIAAVKRIMISPLADVVIEREKQLQQLDHCNVVKFYGSGKDSDFMCLLIIFLFD
jgi:late competence protein required for DNA uptake (superfamily II DNA/RNA helicase)